jgi:two-component system sensor histidine kinase ResE
MRKAKSPDSLQETVESLSRAIGVYEWGRGLAHDMRGPLSAVIGYLDLIRCRFGEASPQQILRYAEFAHEAALRVNRMVGDVLDVVCGEDHNGMVLQRGEVHLEKFFAALTRQFHGMAGEKRIQFDTRIEGESAPPAWADPKCLGRIFDNLLGNAIKFTPNGGSISVSACWTPERYVFEVADTGRGIPMASLEKIFEPLRQVRPGDRQRGHGLGLTLAKFMIRAHQGDIAVESQMGVGSRFTFWIPHRPEPVGTVPILNGEHDTSQTLLFDEAELTTIA